MAHVSLTAKGHGHERLDDGCNLQSEHPPVFFVLFTFPGSFNQPRVSVVLEFLPLEHQERRESKNVT